MLLVLGAALLAIDHAVWVQATTLSVSWGDSARHSLRAVQMAQGEVAAPTPLALGVLGKPGYYPALTQWMALPWMLRLGVDGDTYRLSLSLYSGLLVLGTGALVRRVSGRSAGLAAGALVATVPILWALRVEAMLDAPLAALLALFLAMAPVEGDEPSPMRATLAGLLLAAALLAKQAMLYFALPVLGLLVLRATWLAAAPGSERRTLLGGLVVAGALILALAAADLPFPAVWLALGGGGGLLVWAHRRRAQPGWGRLRDVLLAAVIGALLAGTWYARSIGYFRSGLAQVAATHDVATGAVGLVRSLGYVEYLWRSILTGPIALLLPVGLVVAWFMRGPRLRLVLLALVCGFVGLARFEDLHSRHFVPLVPLLLVVATLPLGLVARRWPRLAAAAALPLVAYGLVFALSWRWPERVDARWQVSQKDSDFAPDMPAHHLGELGRRMLMGPNRWLWAAPEPVAAQWPIDQAVARLVADAQAQNKARGGSALRRGQVMVYADDAQIDSEGVLLYAEQAGVYWLDVRAPQPMAQLQQAVANDGADLHYAFELVGRGGARAGASSGPLAAAGFSEVERWPALLPGRRGALELVLRRGPSTEGAGR